MEQVSEPRKKQKHFVWMMIVLLPLWLALLVFMINPGYMTQLFLRDEPYFVDPYLPCGWLLLLAAAGLVGIALATNAVVERSVGSTWLLALAKILIVLLIVFPAVFIVLVAPALFQVMRSGALGAITK